MALLTMLITFMHHSINRINGKEKEVTFFIIRTRLMSYKDEVLIQPVNLQMVLIWVKKMIVNQSIIPSKQRKTKK